MKEEFLDLYNKWHSSFIFSAHGAAEPAAKGYYMKLKEWCENHREEALQYIREILFKEPSDIVYLLDDIYKEEYNVEVNGFWPLDEYCNLWLNVTDPDFEHKIVEDYYKDYNEWHKHLDELYILWDPRIEDDPNVTLEQFKEGKRNSKELHKQKTEFFENRTKELNNKKNNNDTE